MGTFRCSILLLLTMICASCEKKVLVSPQITVDNVYVELVSSDRVHLSYQLSSVGYEETGVIYYKKSDPGNKSTVNAIRQNGVFRLVLQALEENTGYVFNVFYSQADELVMDSKTYTTKTLSAAMSKLEVKVNKDSITYDDDGAFTAEIEGENLNNLNLSQLEIMLDNVPLKLDYPIRLANGSYKMVVKGITQPVNRKRIFRGQYQGRDIMFQSVSFAYEGERFWLTFSPTNIRTYPLSVFNNELFHFAVRTVNKWNAEEERFVLIGEVPPGFTDVFASGFEFDGQLFFPVHENGFFAGIGNAEEYFRYPEAYSYSPASNTWTTHPFKEHAVGKIKLFESKNYFLHKGELYLSYTISNEYHDRSNEPARSYIYHYNRSKKQFEKPRNIGTNIIYYHFVQVNNQLYLVGLVPVYDQGLILSGTLGVFKVGDDFTLEEIYRAGDSHETLTVMPKSVAAYQDRILIANDINDFMVFDLSNRELSRVHLKQEFPHMYLGNFFRYKDKLHLNADWGFLENRTYEISIYKGH